MRKILEFFVDPKTLIFKCYREEALAKLKAVIHDPDSKEPYLCRYQEVDDFHVGAYCNTLSYFDAVQDLLMHGTWCDEIDLMKAAEDSCLGEELFRYYMLVFLPIDQIFDSFRKIGQTAIGPKEKYGLTGRAEKLMTYINNVWKHHNKYHDKTHHHGPYIPAEAKEYVKPVDGEYFEVGLNPKHLDNKEGRLALVLPSLTGAIDRIGEELQRLMKILDQEDKRRLVAEKWGTPSSSVSL